MKNLTQSLVVLSSRITVQKVRLVIFVITLSLFVLAAGAPGATGGIGH
jgi:hypothetical protein